MSDHTEKEIEQLSISDLPGIEPQKSRFIWIKPSEVIPQVMAELGELSPDEIELVQKGVSNSKYRHHTKLEIDLESKNDNYLQSAHVKVGNLKRYLTWVINELNRADSKENVYFLFENRGDDDYPEYKFIFSIPTGDDYFNKKAIKNIINEVKEERARKDRDEKWRLEKEKEEQEKRGREKRLGELIIKLQNKKISAEEFRVESDKIFERG